jgi:transcription antitermination factor NusG
VGDFVRVTADEFENCRATVEAIFGAEATVRFVIFGRDCGTRSFPLRILERVDTLDWDPGIELGE